jgi:hypothetical protein
MEFDPQHGLVERGTAGHRASAEVADVAAEVAFLKHLKCDNISFFHPNGTDIDGQVQRHKDMHDMYRSYAIQSKAEGLHEKARRCIRLALAHKLALFTPFFAEQRAEAFRRAERAARPMSPERFVAMRRSITRRWRNTGAAHANH